jgi:hypothetical protein
MLGCNCTRGSKYDANHLCEHLYVRKECILKCKLLENCALFRTQ